SELPFCERLPQYLLDAGIVAAPACTDTLHHVRRHAEADMHLRRRQFSAASLQCLELGGKHLLERAGFREIGVRPFGIIDTFRHSGPFRGCSPPAERWGASCLIDMPGTLLTPPPDPPPAPGGA